MKAEEKAKAIIELYEAFTALNEEEKQEAVKAIREVNQPIADALEHIAKAFKSRQAGDHE